MSPNSTMFPTRLGKEVGGRTAAGAVSPGEGQGRRGDTGAGWQATFIELEAFKGSSVSQADTTEHSSSSSQNEERTKQASVGRFVG